MGHILLVSGDPSVCKPFSQQLFAEGFDLDVAETLQDARARARETSPDLLVFDQPLRDGSGIASLAEFRAYLPGTPVVMLLDQAEHHHAVQATKLRAHQCLLKPFHVDELLAAVNALVPRRFMELIADSAAMREVKRLVTRVARSRASTVLLTGESGTGKNLIASILHRSSHRSSKPLMNITCSALPESLLDSELFGHERGSFTDARERKIGLLERADGGTVFLDEIGEMSPALQAKMLRFLEEKTLRRVGGHEDIQPDVRIVAATHRDLESAVAAGTFREDLYYRLAVMTIEIPPLRERVEDIAPLAEAFMRRFADELDKRIDAIDPSALAALRTRPWLGNVRELRNAVERAVLLSEGTILRANDFRQRSTRPTPSSVALPVEGVNLEELERDLVRQALARAGGNRSEAGRLLGLNRDQVRYRIQKFRLEGA